MSKWTLDDRQLRAIARRVNPRAEEIVSRLAYAVEAQWKVNIQRWPVVDTGAFVNSVHAHQKSRLKWWVSDGVEYGIYQELGTSRLRARPSLVPAVRFVDRLRGTEEWAGLFR